MDEIFVVRLINTHIRSYALAAGPLIPWLLN